MFAFLQNELGGLVAYGPYQRKSMSACMFEVGGEADALDTIAKRQVRPEAATGACGVAHFGWKGE